tara:strand:- start:664 stop:1314 length:651 start_codon:yes stop_codon:yes gene_type:complete
MTVSLLFYSNYCQNCKQIIEEIKNSPVSLSIKYICIDSESVRSKLPHYINSVPALVVGETNQIFVGNQILGWIKMTSNNNSQYAQPPPPPPQPKGPVGPNAWHNNEMNAFSDMYSFIDVDTSAQGDGGMSMVHNFEILSPELNASRPSVGSIMMPPGAPGGASMPVDYKNPLSNSSNINSNFGSIQMSEKASELDKQMKDMLNRRELEVPGIPARI